MNVSVLMSVFKEPIEFLQLSVESILEQTYKELEFIVVIDNPNNIAAYNYLLEKQKTDKRIHIIRNEQNIGLTRSLNKGLQVAKGKYILRMDADDISVKSRIEEQLAYLEKNQLDLVGCSVQRIDMQGYMLYKSNPAQSPKCIKRLILIDNCIPHPSWLVKKELYTTLRGYRNIEHCEDYDFLLRANEHGYKLGICPERLLNYRVNTNGISRQNSLQQLLTSVYLQNNHKRINEVNQNEINQYLNTNNYQNESEKYEQALQALDVCIQQIKNGKLFSIFKIIDGLHTSKFLKTNLIKIIKIKLIRIVN